MNLLRRIRLFVVFVCICAWTVLPLPAQEQQAPAQPSGQIVESIEFRGARRVSQALWNTGRFDDIRLESEAGRTGMIVRFLVTERRLAPSIDQGTKSIAEILDQFTQRGVVR